MPSIAPLQPPARVSNSHKEHYQLHRYITTRTLSLFHTMVFALALMFAGLAAPVNAQALLDTSFNGTGKILTQYLSFWSKGNDASCSPTAN